MFSSRSVYYQKLHDRLSREAGVREMDVDAQFALLANVLSYIESPTAYKLTDDKYRDLMDKINPEMKSGVDFNVVLFDRVKLILADAIELVSPGKQPLKIGAKIEGTVLRFLNDDKMTPELIEARTKDFVNKLTQAEHLQQRLRSEPGASINPPGRK